jgi:hypothetical protein
MFARKVSVRLKPNSLRKFTNLMECEILPWLRKQQGFLDLITLVLIDGTEVSTISFWDQEGNAQAFNAGGYPQVLEVLEEMLDGIPYVKTFEVVGSTFRTPGCAQPRGADTLLPNARSVPMDFRSCESNV